jgi:hypothetical protein
MSLLLPPTASGVLTFVNRGECGAVGDSAGAVLVVQFSAVRRLSSVIITTSESVEKE